MTHREPFEAAQTTALDLPADRLREPTADDAPADTFAPSENVTNDVPEIAPALEQAASEAPAGRQTSLDLPAARLREPSADDLPAGLFNDEPVDDRDRLQDEAGLFER